MVKKTELNKLLVNSRMLKSTGSWIYCSDCEKTVAYLCYSTYQHFSFHYECMCGSNGKVELEYPTGEELRQSQDELLIKKNRLCCPNDESPLFTIVNKHISNFSFKVVCKECLCIFENGSS